MQGGLANPVLDRVDNFDATMKITCDLLDRLATHRIFFGWPDDLRDLGLGAAHGRRQRRDPWDAPGIIPTPVPNFGGTGRDQVPTAPAPPLTRNGNGGKCNAYCRADYVHLWNDILPLLPPLHLLCRGGIEG